MKYKKGFIFLFLIYPLLTGCTSTMPSTEQVALAAGSVIGGFIGYGIAHATEGHVAGSCIVGSTIGALAGSELGYKIQLNQ